MQAPRRRGQAPRGAAQAPRCATQAPRCAVQALFRAASVIIPAGDAMGDPAIEAQIDEHLDRQDWPAAATMIVQVYGPELLRYLRGVLRDEDQAREVFSETSERLWTSLPSFRREAS